MEQRMKIYGKMPKEVIMLAWNGMNGDENEKKKSQIQ